MSQGNFATSALVLPHCCSLCLHCVTGLSSTLSLSAVWPTYRADKNYSFHPVFRHKIDYCELAVNQRGTFLYWVVYPVLHIGPFISRTPISGRHVRTDILYPANLYAVYIYSVFQWRTPKSEFGIGSHLNLILCILSKSRLPRLCVHKLNFTRHLLFSVLPIKLPRH